METQFVPFELAVKLKELGFNEKCLAWWGSDGIFNQTYDLSNVTEAPLWQQSFDWFRYTYNYYGDIYATVLGYTYSIHEHSLYSEDRYSLRNLLKPTDHYYFYDEARFELLKHLIELCK